MKEEEEEKEEKMDMEEEGEERRKATIITLLNLTYRNVDSTCSISYSQKTNEHIGQCRKVHH